MADDHTVRVARQARAEALLRDEMLTGAFDSLKQEYVTRWLASQFTDTAGREKLYQAAIVIEQVRSHLVKIAADGRLAAKELEALEGQRTLKQRLGIA